MTIEWSEAALAELEEMYEYIAAENEPAARQLVEKILDLVDQLHEHPKLGRPAGFLGARLLVINRYVVTYRIGRAVEILSVTHGAQRK
jgi:toxin ParE1/3/4